MLFSAESRTAMILKQVAGVDYTPTTEWRVAAVTNPPEDDLGTGLEEPTSASYDRLVVTADNTEFEQSAEGPEVINSHDWLWPQATTEGWGTIYGIAFYDDTDTYQGYAEFNLPKVVDLNRTLALPAGSVIFATESTALTVFVQEVNVPIIRTAPNGSVYKITVNNSGNVIATSSTGFGPPTTPTSLTDTSGTLSWTTPTSDGGSPIISYSVWVSDSDTLVFTLVTIVEAGGSNSYEVPVDLSGVFYVTAENSVGSSDPSNEVTI